MCMACTVILYSCQFVCAFDFCYVHQSWVKFLSHVACSWRRSHLVKSRDMSPSRRNCTFKQGDLEYLDGDPSGGCHMLPPDHHIHGYVTMTTTATATDEVPKWYWSSGIQRMSRRLCNPPGSLAETEPHPKQNIKTRKENIESAWKVALLLYTHTVGVLHRSLCVLRTCKLPWTSSVQRPGRQSRSPLSSNCSPSNGCHSPLRQNSSDVRCSKRFKVLFSLL